MTWKMFIEVTAIVLLAAVAVVLILGIKTLFKGDGDKKTSNKLMHFSETKNVKKSMLTLTVNKKGD